MESGNKKRFMKASFLIALLVFTTLIATIAYSQAQPAAASQPASASSAAACPFKKIGIIGASNSVDSSSTWSGILKSKCPNSQFFIEAISGYQPSSQRTVQLPKVLAQNPDLVIISPSGNGLPNGAAHKTAVVAMAKDIKAKGAKVAVLSISPRKYYCYTCGTDGKCEYPANQANWQASTCSSKWSTAIQQALETFNTDLMTNKLGSSDIDYVIDIYTPLGSSSDKDVCGYCGNDGGHLTKQGADMIVNKVMSAVFSGTPGSAAAATTGCGKKVVAVGDSITVSPSYVDKLGTLCGTSTKIINDDGDSSTTPSIEEVRKGVPGDKIAYEGKSTSKMKSDFDTALAMNPDTIIILGGTNDIFGSWTTIKSNLESMYSMAKAKGIRVVAVTIPPYKTAAERKASTLDTIKKANDWIMKESSADVKVNIYDSLVISGSDDFDSTLFKSDRLHPDTKGQEIMAKKIYEALSSSAVPSVAAGTATTATTVTGVSTTVLPKTLYDFIINSTGGLTTIVGIARQNIAVGVKKTVPKVSAAALCQPITADKTYDVDWLKKTYGRTALEVESQLVNVKFMDKDVSIHRLISPALGCVENEIKACAEGKSYSYDSIASYLWIPTGNGLLATSSFGISLDINPSTNPQSLDGTTTSDIPKCVVDAFKKYGFKWGGDFTTGKMPAHFEFMADPSQIVVQQGVTCPAGTTLVTVPATSAEAKTATPASTAASSGTTGSVSSSSTPDTLTANSDFVWPVSTTSTYWNNVVSCYGFRTLGGKTSFHDGVDIAALEGTPLLAITDGTVYSVCKVPDQCSTCNPLQYRRFKKGDCYINNKYSKSKCGSCSSSDAVCDTNAGRCYGYGSNVIIKHADTLYAHYVHMNDIDSGITKGAKVTKGQQIGVVGNTGYSQGNHLHFAIYNSASRAKTGDPDYPEPGKNAFCYFPDSILTKINIKPGSCVPLYGGSGQVVSSSNQRLVKECKLADLSALKDLKPTPVQSPAASAPTSQPKMVQICRPDSTAPTVAGTSTGKGLTCTYCNQGKELLKAIDASSYSSCTGTCCKGPCPSDAVINTKVPFISQCDSAAMGAEGGDCYYNTWTEEQKKSVNYKSNRYCSSACGVASLRMALQTYGKDKTSKELYCPGPDTVYIEGKGSSTGKMAEVAKKTGMSQASVTWNFDWSDVTSKLKQGVPVILFVSDIDMSYTERPYKTKGHYITLYGASDEYVIAQDPGRRESSGKGVVLSKSYVEKAGGRYISVA